MEKEEYITGQRKLLTDFLKDHSDRYYTAAELTKALVDSGAQISKSAVYRNIDSLVKKGELQKSAEKGTRSFSYRYLNCRSCLSHLHMKCLSCGKILHMDDRESQIIARTVERSSAFLLDGQKTMLYGMCERCK